MLAQAFYKLAPCLRDVLGTCEVSVPETIEPRTEEPRGFGAQGPIHTDTLRPRYLETYRHRDQETQEPKDSDIQRSKGPETKRSRDPGTQGPKDPGTKD